MKVHLVDGTYELFRHFFGAPSHRNEAGQEVAAVRGVVGSVLQLLEEGATHVGVATDHVIESFRNDLWPGYKTGEGVDPELWSQAWPLEGVLLALGVVVWPMVELEADDAAHGERARDAAPVRGRPAQVAARAEQPGGDHPAPLRAVDRVDRVRGVDEHQDQGPAPDQGAGGDQDLVPAEAPRLDQFGNLDARQLRRGRPELVEQLLLALQRDRDGGVQAGAAQMA